MNLDGMQCDRNRVLVVEDEAFIAWDLSQILEDDGIDVAGPAPDLSTAFSVVDAGHACAAILDINLGPSTVWPLADALTAKGVPIAFISADHDHAELRERFRDTPRLAKPVRASDVLLTVRSLLANAAC